MTQNDTDANEGTDVECPTCGRDDFKSRRGVKLHHSRAHDESLEPDKTALTCEYCGEGYEVYPFRADESKYCSNKCRNKGRERTRERTLTVSCDWCGDELERYKSHIDRHNGNFCSDKDCYGKWRAENIVGENHPQWIHGKREYGPGWNARKRRKVRERDDHKCQICGITQEEHKEKYNSIHPVHHIIKARKFDDPEKRNAMENLITLCKTHHKKWEDIPLRPQAVV